MVASTDHGLTIGRASDNDLVVAHPSVSAHHAELHFDGEQFLLRDLSSSNGTFVNGERITYARLFGADLEEAVADEGTIWPKGFEPEAAGVIFED